MLEPGRLEGLQVWIRSAQQGRSLQREAGETALQLVLRFWVSSHQGWVRGEAQHL